MSDNVQHGVLLQVLGQLPREGAISKLLFLDTRQLAGDDWHHSGKEAEQSAPIKSREVRVTKFQTRYMSPSKLSSALGFPDGSFAARLHGAIRVCLV